MICDAYFSTYEVMLASPDKSVRELASNELLHFYRQNENRYNEILSIPKTDWTEHHFKLVSRMNQIKTLLKL